MSYAEQFFNTKQNLILQYANDLAFFGKQSYCYRNKDIMLQIIKNDIAMQNVIASTYCYMWARENGYNAIDLFKTDTKISVYNSDLDMTFEFFLGDFCKDGSAIFYNTTPSLFMQHSTATNGEEILNYCDYDIVQYLNGGINWFYSWENKPSTIQNKLNVNTMQPYEMLRKYKGFILGLDTDITKLLKPIEDGFYILPATYEDFQKTAVIPYKPILTKTSDNTYECCCKFSTETIKPGDNVKPNQHWYGCLIEKVTQEQIKSKPNMRAGFNFGNLGTLQEIQNGTFTGACSIFSSTLINLKLKI